MLVQCVSIQHLSYKLSTIEKKVLAQDCDSTKDPSHDGTCGRIFVAEGGGVTDFDGAGSCEVRRLSVAPVSNVASRGLIVVDAVGVGMVHLVVGDVRPQLGLLPGAVSHTRNDLFGVHIAGHLELVLLRRYIY